MALWYVGDPCYAIADEHWGKFCEILSKQEGSLEGSGVQFVFDDGTTDAKVSVYNSGMGGDGSFAIKLYPLHRHPHSYKFGVDAGILSVLPAAICSGLTDSQLTAGQHHCYAVFESPFPPVWYICTDKWPHQTLDIYGNIGNDPNGGECDGCGELYSNDELETNNAGNEYCWSCYENEEEDEEE